MREPVAVLGAILLFAGGTGLAQRYPTRPIRVIAAQSAGASLDTLARIVTPKISDMPGQHFDCIGKLMKISGIKPE